MSQKPLWAPWRMEYLSGPKPTQSSGCVFCELPKEKNDKETLILHRGQNCFVIMNRYPYANGHLMVVPNTHTADFKSLTAAELGELGTLTQHCIRALEESYKCQGMNIGINLGEAAGAGIRYHLHQHIVPRWIGDNNFMPVIGDVRCMPQHLATSYDQLAPFFKRL